MHLLQTIKDNLQSIFPHPLPRFSFPLFSFLTWTIKWLLKITNWPLGGTKGWCEGLSETKAKESFLDG